MLGRSMHPAQKLLPDARLIRLQALSVLASGTFLVLHLVNTLGGALGQDT